MQALIYNLNHGGGPNNNTFNGQSYYNPNTPYGVGTDSYGLVYDLNLLDNPNLNGLTGPATGSHVYSGYNAAPTSLGAAAATRTIANCLADYSVPAQIVVGNGAHSMVATGVETVGQAGAVGGPAGGTGNYTIQYVQVSDPWTGYALQQPASSGGLLGWGFNTWLRYGYDVLGNGQGIAYQMPNGNIVQNVRPGMWFNCFNVSTPQASPGFTSYGYKFTVEPQGPETLDTGNAAYNGSLPAAPSLLPSPITTGGSAASFAASDLLADSTLMADMTSMGTGTLDTNLADMMMLQLPGAQGDGDWLVPYDGTGGTNDVQGALLIDQDTGVIDEATWLTPQDHVSGGYSLAQLDSMMQGEQSGNTDPSDNAIPAPEPSTLVLLGVGSALAAAYRWRRQRRSLAAAVGERSPTWKGS